MYYTLQKNVHSKGGLIDTSVDICKFMGGIKENTELIMKRWNTKAIPTKNALKNEVNILSVQYKKKLLKEEWFNCVAKELLNAFSVIKFY